MTHLFVLGILQLAAEPSSLKVGAARIVITPTLETELRGYYYARMPDGVHDDLAAKALVIDDGKDVVALVACDLGSMSRDVVADARRRITRRIGIPGERVMISATHSHTGPVFSPDYQRTVGTLIADSVVTAYHRRAPARLKVAFGHEDSLPHNRRYLLKNGTVRTNPGFTNPDVVRATGGIDPKVPVVLVEDEQSRPVATWVNYALHLDTVGGTWISADFPHYLESLLAKVKGPEMLTIFTIGAAGDINHWDVSRPGPQRGFEEARRIGEVLGAAVIKAYTKMERVDGSRVLAATTAVDLPVSRHEAKEVAEAKKVLASPAAVGVDFTLDRVRATKIVSVSDKGFRPVRTEVQALAIGPVAFVSVPGELFVELGLAIQKRSPFPYTFVVEQANDGIGYIPTKDSFVGAYEDTSSRLAPGGGEAIVEAAVRLLEQLGSKTDVSLQTRVNRY